MANLEMEKDQLNAEEQRKQAKKEEKAQAKLAKKEKKMASALESGSATAEETPEKKNREKMRKQKTINGRKLKNWKNKRGKNLYVGELALRACDVDLANRWRPSAIFVGSQEFGELASIFLGCSHQDLADKGAFFILLRQRIEVMQYPRAADALRAETWAGEVQRTIFPRYYRYFDEEGTLCATASTLWALCSIEERKIIRPQDIGLTMPPPPFEELPQPGKLRFEEAPDFVRIYKVRYSDMDYNGHVNNTRYVDWCCDLFATERFKEHSFKDLQINYVHEARQGEEVRLELRDRGDSFSIRGSLQESGQVIFQAAGNWMDALPNEQWRLLAEDDE